QVLVAGFVFFRLFDILKPPPARRLEALPGATGIMADDLVAGLYANLLLQVAVRLVPGWWANIYIISPSERGVYDSGEKFDLAYIYPGLKLKISAENLVNLILGRLPVNVYDMGAVPELSVDGERIKLVFHSETSIGQNNTLWVNGMNFRVEKAEFTLDNGARSKINYEYFDSLIDGYYFPRIIEFSSEGLSISIIYEPDVELNKNVDKTLFKPGPEVVKFEK
ncbi:MAG: phosphatidylglycerophosphatase A, partial [Thermodesulfobacteriota bacterium]